MNFGSCALSYRRCSGAHCPLIEETAPDHGMRRWTWSLWPSPLEINSNNVLIAQTHFVNRSPHRSCFLFSVHLLWIGQLIGRVFYFQFTNYCCDLQLLGMGKRDCRFKIRACWSPRWSLALFCIRCIDNQTRWASCYRTLKWHLHIKFVLDFLKLIISMLFSFPRVCTVSEF
jgi:hypothetical protein